MRETCPAPDFATLRAERNAKAQAWAESFAAEHGVPLQSVRTSHDPNACYCACGTGGPCEHRWDGPDWESDDGCCWSATCSRCGSTAISHSMRTAP